MALTPVRKEGPKGSPAEKLRRAAWNGGVPATVLAHIRPAMTPD
jgi:hypothetical protein